MKIKSIKDFSDLTGKTVFLRTDYNVPVKKGIVQDDFKIIKQLPTIHYLLRHKCRIIIATHFGRPEPGVFAKEFSTKILAKHLEKALDKKIAFCPDFNFLHIGTKLSKLKAGEIMMLENIRFDAREKKNDKKFAKQLANLADIYINDAFGVSHRADASVSAIKAFLPSYAGLLMENEIKSLDKVLNPEQPLIFIVGGVKLETKIPLIKKFEKKAFRILVGGALANNFLAAHGFEIGQSVADKQSIKLAKKFKKKNILLPLDVVVSDRENKTLVRNLNEIQKDDHIFDIGPRTIKFYATFIKRAQTIIWNGPMGFFEMKSFRFGTKAIARLVATRSSGRAFGVVGGGETVEALKETRMMRHVDWISTGGGGMLSFLGGEKMPGLDGIIIKK